MNRALLFVAGLAAALLAACGSLSFLLYTVWPALSAARLGPIPAAM